MILNDFEPLIIFLILPFVNEKSWHHRVVKESKTFSLMKGTDNLVNELILEFLFNFHRNKFNFPNLIYASGLDDRCSLSCFGIPCSNVPEGLYLESVLLC